MVFWGWTTGILWTGATGEGRAICTRDDEDFEREHNSRLARGEIHFGIVTVGDWTVDQTFVALQAFLESVEDTDMLNQFVTLPEP